MPREAHLDIPRLVCHAIARGIERREIFLDDADRQAFCDRFSSLLEQTGTECLAWALLPNHLHLLLRTSDVTPATFMRRLLTGYAVTFNLRHRRAGRLFQNRYKSIVCEEEEYLLELVRYIHLNPIRAGQVANLEALATYPWSGHAVVLGHKALSGQAVNEVLGRFGRRMREAPVAYELFVAAGVGQGRREELSGGGLRRSLALLGPSERPGSYDSRILGSGEFVEGLRQEEELRERIAPPLSIPELVERVARVYGLTRERVLARSTKRDVAAARGVVSCIAVQWLGVRGTEVGRVLGLTHSGVSRSVARGRAILGGNPHLMKQLLDAPKGGTPVVNYTSRGRNFGFWPPKTSLLTSLMVKVIDTFGRLWCDLPSSERGQSVQRCHFQGRHGGLEERALHPPRPPNSKTDRGPVVER